MGYGRFVGRVGALAVALGVGLAAPAIAAADPGDDSAAGDSPAGAARAESSPVDAPTRRASETRGRSALAPAEDPGDGDAEVEDSEAGDTVDEPAEPEAAPDEPSDGLVHDEPAPTQRRTEPAARRGDRPVFGGDIDDSGTRRADTAFTDVGDSGATDAGDSAVAAEPDVRPSRRVARTAVDDPAEARLLTAPAAEESVTGLADHRTAAATLTAPDTADTATTPVTGLGRLVSRFLAILGIGQSAGTGSTPLPAFEFVTAVLGTIRREIDRLFANHGPTAAVAAVSRNADGAVTGTIDAVDPEGDRLVYTVLEGPAHGTVHLGTSGQFTYRADAAATAGADTFVIGVRDAGLHLRSVTPLTTAVPVTVTLVEADSVVGARVAATSVGTGRVYHVTTSGGDIDGFDPTRDKLDLGDVSVHNFIVVDTAEGVGFRNPWSGQTAVIRGVSLGQLTVDSFTPIINDHLRQDLSGAIAWEHGVVAAPGTVYARSHELGQIDRVAFNPATDVVDFRYYGTREQISVTDTPEGVVISNAGTGQALVLQGVSAAQLSARNFVFHNAQVREDRLNQQLGIGAVPDSQVRPQNVPVAGTTAWPVAAGPGAPPSGQTGTTTKISWQYGSHTVISFDPAVDKLDFGWFRADNFDVSEAAGSTRIAIVGNDQSYTLAGVAVGALQISNIIALDDSARAKWQNLIYAAVPPVPVPSLTVGDASVAEGDSGSTTLSFQVTLSGPATDIVTVGYTTSTGTATVADDDYVPLVGTLTFAPGETVKTVAVAVNGDTTVELDEQLSLRLSAPVNATIADGVGAGTIVNDDVDTAPSAPPAVSVADLAVAEGDGTHNHFMFVVTLDKAPTETVTVRYVTSDGTAAAGSDYVATSGVLTFAPGVTMQLLHVDVIGDTATEAAETFTVTLTEPTGVTLADAVAIGTIVDDDAVAGQPGLNSGNPGDALWGEAHFAPYVDMGLWPVPDLLAIAQSRGTSLLTLGFLQATQDGALAWAGLPALAPDSDFEQARQINASIAALRAAGGDVMISLGGAAGTSLAQWYAARGLSASALADAYVDIVDHYALNRIDFDIEGAAVADTAAVALGSQALRLLQQHRPDLEVWYTLPVLPSGLTADGLAVVRGAVNAGAALDGVNIMAMDYGESAAPTTGPNAQTMGAYAIAAAESTYTQLSALYAEFGQAFGWNQIGITPMIGVNDVTTEVFTVADAQALEDFARAKGVGMLSMWSVTRDNPGTLGQATNYASGISAAAGAFSGVWNDYGTTNVIVGPPPALSISDVTVTEDDTGQAHAVFLVTLDKPSASTVTVRYSTSDGTATAGTDYTSASGTLTFAPGVTSQQVHVAVTADTADEADERFTVTLSDPTGATLADATAIGTVTDDDGAAPQPGSGSVTYVVNDNWGAGFVAAVTLTAGESGLNGWTVEFDTPALITNIWNAELVSRTGEHYVVRNASWNAAVAAGQAVEFGFQAGTAGGISTATNFVVNGVPIGPDPAPVAPKVTVADAGVTETDTGTTNMVFTVTLDKVSATPVSIAYATSNGTAAAGSDFTAASGVLSFAAGELTQQIAVPILGDTAVEQDETFTLTLSDPNGVTIADGSAVGTIANDDVAAPAPGGASAVFAVTDNWGSGFTGAVTVTAGSSALNGWTVEFDSPAQISNIWNAEIVDRVGTRYVVRNAPWNPSVAAGQSVSFGFQASPGGASATATNFAVNGQPSTPAQPIISVADASAGESDGATQMTFLVTLSKASSDPVTVTYATAAGTATAGVDYTAASGTVTFAPGVLSQQIQVSITGDTDVEQNETFTLTLSDPSGATIGDGSAVGTITDDVALPGTVSLSISDASVLEGAPGSSAAAGYFQTAGNQIVDAAGNPVQIAGVNWFGMESDIFAPHGLWTRNYKEMMDQMAALDFNTIRLAYSSQMLHTTAAPSGIDFHKNPDLAGLSPLQIMDKIVDYAGELGMRIILDHHRSSAGAGPNGNGLWYEGAYTEAAWIDDWTMLAQRYADDPTVIGADLHNEPHNGTWGGGGATDWAAAAERAGNAILSVNSGWLIFVEGVAQYQGQSYWWGGNLMGVRDRPIVLDVPNRVVYSPHDYPNSVYNQPWFQSSDFGVALPDKFEQMWGYIYEQNIAPIYLGEFGTRLTDPKDVVWFEAITSYLSGDFDNDGSIDIAAGTEDMSWTFWSWNPNSTDTGGILADDWNTVNTDKMAYLQALQFDFADGGSGVLAQFVVALTAPTNQTVTVHYTTSDGTATGGSDYTPVSGTLTFLPGETTKTISVVVFGDTLAESTESFVVTLSSPSGATLADASGAGTILDRSIL
ncbi:chitinase [Mycolicibacterium duvalii]|uniref:Calx-beta domain-containing protein n=1 Tax=Mycolicibacterium duvalii TaxID=39688 RepID=UPI000BEECC38|nr:Calx-beta domain-containing protein [Mycolicibacterium duvalii]PEG40595.1 chitinase [Mycolicibacterium duvalii]